MDKRFLMSFLGSDSRRTTSLKQFSPKGLGKIRLFKTNSVSNVDVGLLNALSRERPFSLSARSTPTSRTPSPHSAGKMESSVRQKSATPQPGGVSTLTENGGRESTPRGSSSSTSTSSGQGSGSGTESRGGTSDGGASSGVATGLASSPGDGVPPHLHSLGVSQTPRSLSLASISSEGSTESHLVEHEDIVALSASVRAFKEALGKLRKLFTPEIEEEEDLSALAHERLGEVLRILRAILERYSPIQHNELLSAAAHLISLISNINKLGCMNAEFDPGEFIEAIDHLALEFSSRVSDYLMGDLDTSSMPINSSSSSRTKSCDNLLIYSDAESTVGSSGFVLGADFSEVAPDIDDILFKHEKGVELALHRAKIWCKFSKDLLTYMEKRSQLCLDFARNQSKLASAIKPMIKEESFLPLQSLFCAALDHDIESAASLSGAYTLLQTSKFIEPLTARRVEHEKSRKMIKDQWYKQLRRLTEAANALRKAKMLYFQRSQELVRLSESPQKTSLTGDQMDKLERKKEELTVKVRDSMAAYSKAVRDANEQHSELQKVKRRLLRETRVLLTEADATTKAVLVSYFQMLQNLVAPEPIQFQNHLEISRLYEPGSQYAEFIWRLVYPLTTSSVEVQKNPFEVEQFSSLSSALTEDIANLGGHIAGHPGSDTDSIGSSRSTRSAEGSPTSSPIPGTRRAVPHNLSSGEELEGDAEGDVAHSSRRQVMSKAAGTHTFRKLKTPSRCRECDSYVYFHGYECSECGLGCHKKCLETLAIQCGHKRLPRKLTTFGIDLQQHLQETNAMVPHLVTKCLKEIDSRGINIKGIYRVSGLKSRVEKLCQAFENGAQLVDLTDQHPNVIANVLKLYLRQLPEPLLTFRLYPEFIRIAKDHPSLLPVECQLRDLAKRLPPHHLCCLAVLMLHLNRVSQHAEKNNMPPSNLGIVFGPTLLRTSEGSASLSSLIDTVHQTKVIELLVQYAKEVFGSLDILMQRSTPHQELSVDLKTVSSPSSSSSSTSSPSAGNRMTKTEDSRALGRFCARLPTVQMSGNSLGSGGAGRQVGGGAPGDHHYTLSPQSPANASPRRRGKSETTEQQVKKEEEWDWSSDELFGSLPLNASSSSSSTSDLRPHKSIPVIARTSASIIKTSLKDYVGLEMAALQEQRLSSLDVPSHTRLKKTMSDTPPGGTSSGASHNLPPTPTSPLRQNTFPSLPPSQSFDDYKKLLQPPSVTTLPNKEDQPILLKTQQGPVVAKMETQQGPVVSKMEAQQGLVVAKMEAQQGLVVAKVETQKGPVASKMETQHFGGKESTQNQHPLPFSERQPKRSKLQERAEPPQLQYQGWAPLSQKSISCHETCQQSKQQPKSPTTFHAPTKDITSKQSAPHNRIPQPHSPSTTPRNHENTLSKITTPHKAPVQPTVVYIQSPPVPTTRPPRNLGIDSGTSLSSTSPLVITELQPKILDPEIKVEVVRSGSSSSLNHGASSVTVTRIGIRLLDDESAVRVETPQAIGFQHSRGDDTPEDDIPLTQSSVDGKLASTSCGYDKKLELLVEGPGEGCSSRETSVENIASTDSSSIDLYTEDSQSSLDQSEESAMDTNQAGRPASLVNQGFSSRSPGASNKIAHGNQQINVDTCGPYGPQSNVMSLGPSLVLTRTTFAQYDTKRTTTTTTTVTHPPKSPSDDTVKGGTTPSESE